MDEKVKAVKKSAEAPQPPSRRMTARAPEIRQTPAPPFGRSARACRISVVSVSGPPRRRFFQGRGSLDPGGSTVFKPERSTLHHWESGQPHLRDGSLLAGSAEAQNSVLPRSHAPILPCIRGVSPMISGSEASVAGREFPPCNRPASGIRRVQYFTGCT